MTKMKTDKQSKFKKMLKEQAGGASNYVLDLTRYDNKYIQDAIRNKCLLTNPALDISNPTNLPFYIYTNLLKDLMNRGCANSRTIEDLPIITPDDEINMMFLNTISAFPIDLREKLSIVNNGTDYIFSGDSNYTIGRTISTGTGSGAIILKLEKNEGIHDTLPQELVLKLIPINYSSYYNYTPLTFQHITETPLPVPLGNSRYYHYTPEQYDSSSFDISYRGFNLIQTERLNITATDLDDFKNEMIQNIICKTILPNDNDILIENYNYVYINVGSKTYGGILMESLNGSFNTYISDNLGTILTNNKFRIALSEYLFTLNLLKASQYRFNHSDLKVENVFYKIDQSGDIKLKLADLDKASITYNGIRFINGKFISKKLNPTTLIQRLKRVFTFEDRFLKINEGITSDIGIEVDQLYLRYGFFPAPPFYDILMLFICLRAQFYSKSDEFLEYCRQETDNIHNRSIKLQIESYLPYEINIIEHTNSIDAQAGQAIIDAKGNFGTIVFRSLINNNIPIPLNFTNSEDHELKQVNLSPHLKLVLVEPKTYQNRATVSKFFGLFSSRTWESQDKKNYIFYTGNEIAERYPGIVKTNRYSSKGLTGFTYLYEWDHPSHEIVNHEPDRVNTEARNESGGTVNDHNVPSLLNQLKGLVFKGGRINNRKLSKKRYSKNNKKKSSKNSKKKSSKNSKKKSSKNSKKKTHKRK